jgi:hypothetical protein
VSRSFYERTQNERKAEYRRDVGRPIHGRQYGRGGSYVRYELNAEQTEYTVTDERGERITGFPFETDAQRFCADMHGGDCLIASPTFPTLRARYGGFFAFPASPKPR